MGWGKAAAYLALGTGLVLTLCVALALAALDYRLWVALYDLGKAAMFWGIARVLGRPLAYASALTAFMIIDFPSLGTYVLDYL